MARPCGGASLPRATDGTTTPRGSRSAEPRPTADPGRLPALMTAATGTDGPSLLSYHPLRSLGDIDLVSAVRRELLLAGVQTPDSQPIQQTRQTESLRQRCRPGLA